MSETPNEIRSADGENQEWKDRADDRFIDSLLREIHDADKSALNSKVSLVMEKVEAYDSQKKPKAILAGKFNKLLTLAAALLLTSLAILPFVGGNPAMAAVQKSLASSLQPLDRRYEIKVDHRSRRWLQSSEGTITVRGADFLVVEFKRKWGYLRFGFDPQEGWLVPSVKWLPVYLLNANSLQDLREKKDYASDVPFFSLSSVLERVPNRYSLELETLPDGEHFLSGTLKDDAVDGNGHDESLPQRFELRSRQSDGAVLHLHLKWAEDATHSRTRQPLPRSMDFTLTSEQPLDDEIYSHRPYHSEDRKVKRY